MNVDAQFSPIPFSPVPARPVRAPAGQASARPVDRPHQDEPSNNQTRKDSQTVGQNEEQRAHENKRTVRQQSELSADEKRELEKLKARDREVRAHEAAHKAAAGSLARGGAQFEFETGPDGRRYAVGGEVSIDTSKVAGNPQATLEKAQTIRRAANAPAQPSSQDRSVAAQATQMEAEARQELREQQTSGEQADGGSHSAQAPGFDFNKTEPAPVGELLDVIV